MRLQIVSWVALVVVVFSVAACSLRRTPRSDDVKERPVQAVPPIAMTKLDGVSLRESNGLAIAKLPDGSALAFLADADDRALVAIDSATLETKMRADLDGTPEQLIVLPTGEIAVALVDAALVVVYALRGSDLVETRRARTGAEPRALALTPDDRLLLVTAGAAHRVQAFDVGTLDLRFSKDVAREPRAIAVTANGKTALVTHATSSDLTMIALDAEVAPAAVQLGLPAVIATCAYSDPSRVARHANAVVRKATKSGEAFWLPVLESASHGMTFRGYGSIPPTTPAALVGVSGNIYGLSAFDVREVRTDPAKSDAPRFTESRNLLEDCLLPRAAIATERGVLVACEGQSEVVEVSKTGREGAPQIISRFATGRGPSALAASFDGKEVMAWARFDRTLAVLGQSRTKVLARSRPFADRIARGREIFHRTGDKRISSARIACATCHPDGRDDGIVWGAPGGDRRTLSLAGNLADRASYGWKGEQTGMTARIAATIRRLEGKGLPDDEVDALGAYLVSLKRPAPAQAIEGEAVSGKVLFASSKAGCAGCHTLDAGFTDHQPHDVGSGGAFLTPSLVGVGARRPLFHDGRYADLDALLKNARSMGGAAELDDDERAALVAFLRAL